MKTVGPYAIEMEGISKVFETNRTVALDRARFRAVSYTHLTLPTNYSV